MFETERRLMDLGVDVYDIKQEHTAEERKLFTEKAHEHGLLAMDYALSMVELIDRMERRIINLTARMEQIRQQDLVRRKDVAQILSVGPDHTGQMPTAGDYTMMLLQLDAYEPDEIKEVEPDAEDRDAPLDWHVPQ